MFVKYALPTRRRSVALFATRLAVQHRPYPFSCSACGTQCYRNFKPRFCMNPTVSAAQSAVHWRPFLRWPLLRASTMRHSTRRSSAGSRGPQGRSPGLDTGIAQYLAPLCRFRPDVGRRFLQRAASTRDTVTCPTSQHSEIAHYPHHPRWRHHRRQSPRCRQRPARGSARAVRAGTECEWQTAGTGGGVYGVVWETG